MNIAEFTETRIDYTIGGITAIAAGKMSVKDLMQSIIDKAQKEPGNKVELQSVRIVKRKGLNVHEIFV